MTRSTEGLAGSWHADGGDASRHEAGYDRQIRHDGASAGMLPEVTREALLESALGALELGRVVMVCAAPGMGKTALLGQLANALGRRGHEVMRAAMGGMDGEPIVRELRRYERSLTRRRTAGQNAMIVDDVPSLDDFEAGRIAERIQRISSLGCHVVLALRPEASQLAELVADALVLTTQDLMVHPNEVTRWCAVASDSTALALISLTGGICCLMNEARLLMPSGDCAGGTSFASLPSLLGTSLRHALMDEERAARLAMLLLGRGTFEDIALCAGRVDIDVLRSLASEELLFGVDLRGRTFSCIGAIANASPEHCAMTIADASMDLQSVASSAASLLMRRGDVGRAAFALRCCSSGDRRAEVAIEWACELICCGELRLVRDAVGERGMTTGPSALAARAMLASIDGNARLATALLAKCRDGDAPARVHAQARVMLRVCLAQKGVFADEDDLDETSLPTAMGLEDGRAPNVMSLGMAYGLMQHVRVRWLMAQGRVEDAYQELLLRKTNIPGGTLAGALLEEDAAVLGVLMGDMATYRESTSSDDSVQILMTGGFPHQLAYQMAEREVLAGMVGGDGDGEQLDRALHVASERGDDLVRAVLLLAKSVRDLSHGALARAHVLAAQSAGMLDEMGQGRLVAMARAIDAAVDLCAGGEGDDTGLAMSAQAVGQLPELELASELVLARRSGEVARMSDAGRCPAASLPILLVLTRSCGDLSRLARDVVPLEWMGDISSLAASWADGAWNEADSDPAGPTGRGGLLDVRMLGGLSVSCAGVEVTDRSWKRKAARELLELLMVVPRHELSRALVVEALWPRHDLVTARNNVYSVLTALRKAIGQREGGPQYVIVDSGHIRIDRGLMHCDLDDFRGAANAIMEDDGDDMGCVRRCSVLEASFPGNIVVPMDDPTGLFTKCHTDVATLYADSMLAGSEAALRMGKATLAVRFARNAADVDPVREDVEERIVRALVAAGRTREARTHYESYATRFIALAGSPPSMRLRRVVRDMCEGGSGTERPHVEEGTIGPEPEGDSDEG